MHGVCVAYNNCDCQQGYFNTDNGPCADWGCYDVIYTNSSVCSGHGACPSPNNCTCDSPYYNENCQNYNCYGTINDSPTVCGGKGECVAPDTCVCSGLYYGSDCTSYSCFDIHYMNGTACSSIGNCISPDKCACPATHYGDRCQYNIIGKPEAIVSGPPTIGICDNIILDGSRSFSTVGEGNLLYLWNYVSGPLQDTTELLDYLTNWLQSGTSNIVLPNHYVGEFGTYVFSLVVVNEDGQPSDTELYTVTKQLSTTPILNLDSPFVQRVYRSNALTVIGYAESDTCFQQYGQYEAFSSFVWVQTSGQSIQYTSPQSHILSIAEFKFPYVIQSTKFEFEITASISGGTPAKRSLSVWVDPSPLVIQINGGNRSHSSKSNLILDGTASYDGDLPSGTLGNNVDVTWTCKYLDSFTDGNCGIVIDKSLQVTITQHSLYAGDYEFTLHVNNGMKTGNTTVLISVIDAQIPVVTLQQLGIVNPTEIVSINSTIIYHENDNVLATYWNLHENNLTVADLFLYDSFGEEAANRTTLILKPDVLKPGVVYTFKLTVQTSEGQAYGSTTINANEAPKFGSMQISPSKGVALDTSFSAIAYGWVDPQNPLEYRFEYKNPVSLDWKLLRSFSLSSVLQQFKIPVAGNLQNDGKYEPIQVRVTIKDSYNARAYAYSTIDISPPPQEDLLELIQNNTKITKNSELNPEQTLQTLKTGIEAINTGTDSSDASPELETIKNDIVDAVIKIRDIINDSGKKSDDTSENIVDTINDITKDTTTLTEKNQKDIVNIIEDEICSYSVNNNATFYKVLDILSNLMDQHYRTSRSNVDELLNRNNIARKTINCLIKHIHRNRFDGQNELMINTKYYSLSFYRDITKYVRNLDAWFGPKETRIKNSENIGDNTEESLSLVGIRYHLPLDKYDTEDTRLSDLMDLHYLNSTAGILRVTDLPNGNILSFSKSSFNASRYEKKQLDWKCKYYHEDKKAWETYGCKIHQESDEAIQCSCDHTTLFSVFYEPVIPTSINTLGVVIGAISGSALFILCCTCFVLFVLCFACLCCKRSKEKKKLRKIRDRYVANVNEVDTFSESSFTFQDNDSLNSGVSSNDSNKPILQYSKIQRRTSSNASTLETPTEMSLPGSPVTQSYSVKPKERSNVYSAASSYYSSDPFSETSYHSPTPSTTFNHSPSSFYQGTPISTARSMNPTFAYQSPSTPSTPTSKNPRQRLKNLFDDDDW